MAFIKAISYYLPEKVVTNEELVKEFPEWSVDKVAQKVGVDSRHLAAENETAGDMAEKAARKLFEEYQIDPKSIDFLMLCTQSPDYFLPSTACILQDRLGIPTSAGAFDYNLGCSGCIYGMAMAKGLIAAGIAKNVLLLTAETYNKYLHPSDKSNRSIFGDGAAACLVSAEGFAEIGEFSLGTDGSGANNLIVKTGASRQKEVTGKFVEDEEGHIWYDDYLYMNGGSIFNFTLDAVPAMMKEILEKNQMQKEDVDYYVFHQANKFMLNTIRKVCLLPKDKFYVNLATTGNTVSSTVLIGVKECLENKDYENARYNFSYISGYEDSDKLLKEASYNVALKSMGEKDYKFAVFCFEEAKGYSDANKKINEAKYEYVKANKNRTDTTTYSYLKDLKDVNYSDAKTIYNDLYAWKVVDIYFNTSESSTAKNDSISKYSAVYCHFTLKGGPPNEKIYVYHIVKYPDGGTRDGKKATPWKMSDGDESWWGWEDGLYYDPYYGATGTLKFTFYDEKGNKIGEGSVKISN